MLGGVGAIGAQVDQVVQQVDAGRAQREGEDAEQRVRQRGKPEQVRRHQRHQQQHVLDVLVHAQQAQPRPERRRAPRQVRRVRVQGAQRLPRARGGPDRDRRRRHAPHLEVGPVVADVVEAALSEPFHQQLGLAAPGQVPLAVRRHPAGEQPQMLGDRAHQALVGGGGQIDRPAIRAGPLDEGDHRRVVGQELRIDAADPDQPRRRRRFPAADRT